MSPARLRRSRRCRACSAEVVRLRAELSQAQLSRAQEAQLRSLLPWLGRGGYRIVAANVIAVGPGYSRR